MQSPYWLLYKTGNYLVKLKRWNLERLARTFAPHHWLLVAWLQVMCSRWRWCAPVCGGLKFLRPVDEKCLSLAHLVNFGTLEDFFFLFFFGPAQWMAVIQHNDNRHCHRPNSVSQHFLLDRDESQMRILWTPCSAVIPIPRVSGIGTEEQIL